MLHKLVSVRYYLIVSSCLIISILRSGMFERTVLFGNSLPTHKTNLRNWDVSSVTSFKVSSEHNLNWRRHESNFGCGISLTASFHQFFGLENVLSR